MATSIKISQLPAKGSNLEATDLLEVSEFNGTGYVSKSITGQEIIDSVPASVTAWGTITGTLSAQTDLQNALNAKQDDITLTTTGTSGASTFVANTLNVPTYSLAGLGGVPTSRTLTINGTTQDLSADRTFTISTGITIGTTAITSGTVGRVLFQGSGNVVQQSSSLFWDSTNNRLGIGTSTPSFTLDILGNVSSSNVGFKLRNSASNGYTEILCFNDGGTLADRMFMGVGGTTTGDAFQNRGYFLASNNLEGINFTATKPTTGDIRFFTGGVNERLRIFGNGNIGINTTTDAGFKLDVNGTARVSGNTKIGNTVYNDANSQLIIGIDGNATRGAIANSGSYQDFIFVSTGIGSSDINSWSFGQRRDTYFGNTIGSFQIVGSYTNNSGAGSMVGGGFRVPLICNPNGDIIISGASNSINGNVSVGSSTITASALLSVTSTTKGFLPPRMTTTQKNAIASPATGLMVYDTTLNLISVYNGTIWISL